MAGGFKWSLDWDTNPLRRGGQQAADAIEDAVDTFEDMAKAADRSAERAGDALADETRAGGRDAERALADLENAFRDTARDAQRRTKSIGDDLGDSVKRGARDAQDATGEFKEEARSNFSEVASSFDGSMDSIVDLAQGTFGGLAGSIAGPVGIAAGVVAAAGGAAFAAWQEAAEKTKETVRSMYEDMRESGQDYLSDKYIQEALDQIVSGGEDAAITLKEANEIVGYTGASLSTVLRAYAGDASAAADVSQLLAGKIVEQGDAASSTTWRLNTFQDRLTGTTSSATKAREQVEIFNEAVNAVPESRVTTVNADTGTAQRRLLDLARPVETPVRARFDADDAERQIQTAINKTRFVELTPRVGNMRGV